MLDAGDPLSLKVVHNHPQVRCCGEEHSAFIAAPLPTRAFAPCIAERVDVNARLSPRSNGVASNGPAEAHKWPLVSVSGIRQTASPLPTTVGSKVISVT